MSKITSFDGRPQQHAPTSRRDLLGALAVASVASVTAPGRGQPGPGASGALSIVIRTKRVNASDPSLMATSIPDPPRPGEG